MNNIKILDCTLRDGGYINDFRFGYSVIRSMLLKLTQANIDVIECGFLEDGKYDPDCSMFTHVDQIEKLLPQDRGITEYVAMTRYGFLNIDHLKAYDGKSIGGIRITFHENEVDDAIAFCKQVQAKGYKVYVQPVGTTSYTDQFLLRLIDVVNEIKPYAFYIVDTLGLMKKNDLFKMYYLIDNNLAPGIILGFHSHNNLQLSFSNSQELVDMKTTRVITLDSSVYGMGRGAGNLNTELISQYLNDTTTNVYHMEHLLEIVDETIKGLREQYTWGYSVPYYLAAINNCHPNYAAYLMDRNTLTVKSISKILKSISQDQRELYNKAYIQELYTQYQKHHVDDLATVQRLGSYFKERNILILAPGASIRTNLPLIEEYVRENDSIVISVNFDGGAIKSDYCFYSNDKRYQKAQEMNVHSNATYKMILTSNIENVSSQESFIVNYSDLLNSQPLVDDNATLMLIALLIKFGVPKAAVAGFDGFRTSQENYSGDKLSTKLDEDNMQEMNRQIAVVTEEYSSKLELQFITESLYLRGREGEAE